MRRNFYKIVSLAEEWPIRELFRCLASHAANGMALAGPCMRAGSAHPMAFAGLRATTKGIEDAEKALRRASGMCCSPQRGRWACPPCEPSRKPPHPTGTSRPVKVCKECQAALGWESRPNKRGMNMLGVIDLKGCVQDSWRAAAGRARKRVPDCS